MAVTKANGFTIEDDIPLPEKHAAGLTAALGQLKVGQSILVAAGERGRVSAALTYAQHKHQGRKFAQRTVEGGKRVWRTA